MLAFIVLSAAAVVLSSIILHAHHPLARVRHRHWPGPTFLPLKGVDGDFIARAGGLQAACAEWARRHGPTFKFFIASQPVVCVTDPADVRRALTTLRTRPQWRGWPGVAYSPLNKLADYCLIQTPDPHYHSELKRAWQPFFSPAALAAHAPAVEAAAKNLAAKLTAAATTSTCVDVMALAREWAGEIIFQAAFGLTLQGIESAEFAEAAHTLFTFRPRAESPCAALYSATPPWLRPVVRLIATFCPDPGMKRVIDTRATVVAHLTRRLAVAKERVKAGVPPLASGGFFEMLLTDGLGKGPTARPMTDAQLISSAQTLVLSSFDTTANALAFALHSVAADASGRLADDLAAEAKAVAAASSDPTRCFDATASSDPARCFNAAALPLATAVIDETLRLYPPIAIAPRLADGVFTVAGRVVPRGTWIHTLPWAAHRSEEIWGEDAAQFKPSRFLDRAADPPAAYIPFGPTSPMACVGKRLAYAEIRAALGAVFGDAGLRLTLAPGQVPLPLTLGIALQPVRGVWVTPRVVEEKVEQSAVAAAFEMAIKQADAVPAAAKPSRPIAIVTRRRRARSASPGPFAPGTPRAQDRASKSAREGRVAAAAA